MDPEQRVWRENNPLDHALDLAIRQRDEARKEHDALTAENARLREALITVRSHCVKAVSTDLLCPDGISDEALDTIGEFEDAIHEAICEGLSDHVMTEDHCGKPEHDFCLLCRKRREDLESPHEG